MGRGERGERRQRGGEWVTKIIVVTKNEHGNQDKQVVGEMGGGRGESGERGYLVSWEGESGGRGSFYGGREVVPCILAEKGW